MLEKIQNVFSIPELKKRILFTAGLLIVYRLGGHIPTPGVDARALDTMSKYVFMIEVLRPN